MLPFKSVPLLALTKVTATGVYADVDLSPYLGIGSFELTAKSEAGTNPTLDVKLQSSGPKVRGYSYTTAGITETKLKTGASTLVKHALTFTQSGAASVKAVGLVLKKIGTLAAGKKVTVEICADNSGAPGTALGSTTIDIDTEVTTSFDHVTATFATPIDVADATVYHIVLSADYTASATNCVVVRSNTVASGGTQQTFDGTSWSAVTTEKIEAFVDQLVFADVTGLSFTQVTTTASRQTKYSPLEVLPRYLRVHATIGGTSSPSFYLGVDVLARPRRLP